MNSLFGRRATTTVNIGAEYEKRAEAFLRKAGLTTLCRNYRCRAGEIDLIMSDTEFVAFVEVRYRSRRDYGDPLETINAAKQRRIIRAATHYLSCTPAVHDRPCRFDAIGVYPETNRIRFEWVKDAFST